MHCAIDNGLSNDSKEQLKKMSGEDIVNNDVSKQGYEKTE